MIKSIIFKYDFNKYHRQNICFAENSQEQQQDDNLQNQLEQDNNQNQQQIHHHNDLHLIGKNEEQNNQINLYNQVEPHFERPQDDEGNQYVTRNEFNEFKNEFNVFKDYVVKSLENL